MPRALLPPDDAWKRARSSHGEQKDLRSQERKQRPFPQTFVWHEETYQREAHCPGHRLVIPPPHACGADASAHSVRGTATGVPEAGLRGSHEGLACTQERISSHWPANGSLLVRRQSKTLTRCGASWESASASVPSCKTTSAAHASRSKSTSSEGGVDWLAEDRPASQRKVACCMCSTCWKR